MHFALTEDQAAIQETALTFAKERIAPGAAEWDEKSHFPVDVIRETAALGMATIYVPAEKGGSGLTRLDGALIFEALAYGCPAISSYISIHNMVAWMVAKYGTPEQAAAWVPKLATMEWLSSYCLTEPGAGSDAAALKTRATPDGDTYRITGTKAFISGAGISDLYPDGSFNQSTGSLSGSVTHNGVPVYGAHVVAFNPRTGDLVGNFTLNSAGQFSIGGLSPGAYIVRVEPIDDAEVTSFLEEADRVDVEFRSTIYSRLVVVPRRGDSGQITIPVAAR